MRFDISHRRRSRGDGLDSLARVGRPFRMPLRVLPAAFLSGCDGIQAIMNPHGPDAAEIATIGWIMFGGATVIFVIVLALMLYALIARPDRRRWLGGIKLVIAGGVVLPVVALTALLVYTLSVNRALTAPPGADALRIQVIGRMWWWEVRYLDPEGGIAFETANEIHVPVGRTVSAELATADVIHSFWVPNLAGKLDMIPGQDNRLTFRADRPGVYRGQCAEYCGAQHAQMAFYVVAEQPDDFARWFESQRAPAREPRVPFIARGRQLFLDGGCGACHTVRGTPANGELGPDLTHVGSRLSIAAGSFDNHVGTLEAWIAASQRLKPGNRMPSFDVFEGQDLRALAAYLESLK